MFTSSNPALKTSTFARFREDLSAQVAAEKGLMTIEGTVNKTGALLILTVAGAVVPWTLYFNGQVQLMEVFAGAGGFTALALSFFTLFMNPRSVVWVAPIFAGAEGLALGGLSARLDSMYPGIAVMAAMGTLAVLAAMLAVYKFKIVKVTERFKSFVMTAVGAVILIGLASIVTRLLFGFSLLHFGGPLGIVVSLVIIGVFSAYLLVSFKQIEEAAAARAPKWMEWYGAFGILVALVWLYLEILHLLSILRE